MLEVYMSARMSRGQGAMEYLMTYGWAILVVMIVGIVMWQLGIFNIGQGSTTATGFAKIKPQLAGSFFNGASASTNFIFTNGAAGTIRIQEITITDNFNPATGCTVASDSADIIGGTPPNVILRGENFRISSANCLSTANVGEVYNARIRISYTIFVLGQRGSHVESGTLRGTVE